MITKTAALTSISAGQGGECTTENVKVEPTAVESLAVAAENQISNRTHFIIAANAFLFGAFATMVSSVAMTGYLRLLPIFVSIGGIGLNAFLRFANKNQAERIRKTLNPQSSFAKAYFNIGIPDMTEDKIFSGFNQGAPILMIILWTLTLIVYGAVATGII